MNHLIISIHLHKSFSIFSVVPAHGARIVADARLRLHRARLRARLARKSLENLAKVLERDRRSVKRKAKAGLNEFHGSGGLFECKRNFSTSLKGEKRDSDSAVIKEDLPKAFYLSRLLYLIISLITIIKKNPVSIFRSSS